jgi:hypothetical protein
MTTPLFEFKKRGELLPEQGDIKCPGRKDPKRQKKSTKL